MEFIGISLSIISGLLVILIGILGFWAKKVDGKLDRIENKQAEHNTNTIERLTRVEGKVDHVDGRVNQHHNWLENLDNRVRTIEIR
ncbi:MAG: hypothetical protein ACK52I_00665 [Pseudomonadota bacterium]|jgi:ABC-type nickel/cobalt efflux system permease component RcnA